MKAAGYYTAVVVVVLTVWVAHPWAEPDPTDTIGHLWASGLVFALVVVVEIGIPTLGIVWLIARGTRRFGRPWVTRVAAALLTVWIPGVLVLFGAPYVTALVLMAFQVVFAATYSPTWPPQRAIERTGEPD